MNRALSTVLVAACALGCSTPAPRTPKDDTRKQEMAIVMAVGVQETSHLKVGQWALYSVRTAGSTVTASTRLAVVGAEGNTFWIENRTVVPDDSGRPQTLIWKYQIDAAAKPLRVWVAQPPGKPADVPMEKHRPPTTDSKAKVQVAKERIRMSASDKEYDCSRLTSKAVYPDGRETTLTTWCSDEVPFPAVHDGKAYGGIVRRTYGPHTLELTAKGTDAVAELSIPEK